MKATMKNVIDKNGEHRIAAIKGGKWISISAGVASLEGRENGMNPHGQQCPGHWLGGSAVTDAKTGETYPQSNNP